MNWFKLSAATAIVALCSACASTPPVVDTNVKIDFPQTSPITSIEQADAALAAVDLSRQQIDWRYRQKELICYDKFFMNSCLRDAKAERRRDLAIVKKSEVDANFFKRKNDVEEMDRNLVEKNVANPLPAPPNPGPAFAPDPDQHPDSK